MDSKRIYELAKKISELSFSLISEINDSEIEAEKRRSLFQIMPNIKKPKEGSIITRQDGRFEGRYMAERRQKSVYGKTYNDCLNRLNKAIKARDGEVKSVIMFYGWIDEYLQVYKKPDLKPDTYSAYLGYVNNYIKKHCADCPIAAIKPIDLKKILNSIEFERTRESVYNLLSGIFKQAFAEQYILFNPMLGVKRITHSREKGKALTIDEQTEFILKLKKSPLKNYYLFCLFSGCRRGESLGVKYEDIDFNKKLIHIRGTKTDGSDRLIPLFKSITELLRDLPDSGNLFLVKADYVTRNFKKLCPAHRLHDLRHTFATRCLECGIPLKVVQGWLGHSSIDTTADIYVDVLSDFGRTEAEKLDNIFKF